MKNINTTAGIPAVGSLIELQIDKLAIGGAGIARHHGFVYFVAKTAPGDLILAEVTEVKKNHAVARLKQIMNSSPLRRQAPCQIAEQCGGCTWQHLSEVEQCRQKELLFKETFQKFLPQVKLPEFQIHPNPKPWGYRNRVQPKASQNQFGFFAESTHQIISTDQCLITEELINQKWLEIKKTVQSKITKDEIKKLEIYIDENETVRFHEIDDVDDGIGFSQVNRFQNLELINTVSEYIKDLKPTTVYEFYSGAGNFTFPIYDLLKPQSLVAIEMNSKLVQRAKEKIGKRKVIYYCASVDNYIKRFACRENDLVVLDPPRAGCGLPVMKAIASARPKDILYISCHPVSLVRDLAPLVQLGYQIKKVNLFDMFSQTDHMESILHISID